MLRHPRLLALLAACALVPSLPGTDALAAGARVQSASPFKRYQAALLLREPLHEKKERREREKALRELAREMKRHGRTAIVRRGQRDKPEVKDEDARLGLRPAPRTVAAARVPGPLRASAPPTPNVRVNDTTGDAANETQSETSIAAWGDYMVAAWNDSKGWPSEQAQGWATSTDGGQTWTDRGTLPTPTTPSGWRWASDPVVSVNPNTGAFYYAGLADAAGGQNGIGVIMGRFSGGTFTWTTKVAARVENASSNFLDKEWLSVDPGTGRVLLSYTNFTSGLDQIEFQSADSVLAGWTSPVRISADAEAGFVQASRAVAGANGDVYVAYYGIGLVDADYVRFSRSTNGGASFSAPVNAVSFFSNYGTGAPGFNRDSPIPNFPSLAVDHSSGPHRGRIYLAWAECLNWYDDTGNAGASGAASEVEPNETAAAASPMAPGNLVRGALASTADFDYFRVHLDAGQTILAFADSSNIGVTLSLRMFAADGVTRLAWTTASGSDVAAGYKPGWIWTAPASGDYFLRVASQTGSGGYRLRTGLAARAGERGSDQRDVFVAHSDDGGANWSAPVRVDDAPIGLDGWLPEVAVGPDGEVWFAWYDWRDSPAAASGGESQVYLARSTDGGANWTTIGAASDTLSNWTVCQSAFAPNQGDYMSLFASSSRLAVCWSDARGGTPDAYVSVWPIGATSTQVSLVSATAVPGRVDLDWTANPPDGFRAALHRTLAGTGSWSVLDTVTAAGDGHVVYADTTVAPGATYTYRLGVLENGTEYFRGQVTVLVPSGLGLALRGVIPNPTDGSGAHLAFTLPYAEPADIEIFDLTGRLVDSRLLTGYTAASHVIPFTLWSSARSGVYLVRITQRGHSLTSRVSIVR
ncbi:MAG: T9SS type A sorting domain-containing protein [Candidatus Eisenbacteria bacterium]|nr:T9SS type A sorting domain-containing protein [Candidatus Eisenbacteria bacterium]